MSKRLSKRSTTTPTYITSLLWPYTKSPWMYCQRLWTLWYNRNVPQHVCVLSSAWSLARQIRKLNETRSILSTKTSSFASSLPFIPQTFLVKYLGNALIWTTHADKDYKSSVKMPTITMGNTNTFSPTATATPSLILNTCSSWRWNIAT